MVVETEDRDDSMPLEVMELTVKRKSNVIKILKKSCPSGKWHEYHTHAGMQWCILIEGRTSISSDIELYKAMQQIYKNNIFPVVRDQLGHNCRTNLPLSGQRQTDHPKKKGSQSRANSLIQMSCQLNVVDVIKEDTTTGHVKL